MAKQKKKPAPKPKTRPIAPLGPIMGRFEKLALMEWLAAGRTRREACRLFCEQYPEWAGEANRRRVYDQIRYLLKMKPWRRKIEARRRELQAAAMRRLGEDVPLAKMAERLRRLQELHDLAMERGELGLALRALRQMHQMTPEGAEELLTDLEGELARDDEEGAHNVEGLVDRVLGQFQQRDPRRADPDPGGDGERGGPAGVPAPDGGA